MSAEQAVGALTTVDDGYLKPYDASEKRLEVFLEAAMSSADDQKAYAEYLSLSLQLWEVTFTQTLNASPLSQANVDKVSQYFGNLINKNLVLVTPDNRQRDWIVARLLTVVKHYYATAHMASLGAVDTRVRLPGALSLFNGALAAEDKLWRAISKAYNISVPWLEKGVALSATPAPTVNLKFDAQYSINGINQALASGMFKPPCYVCLGPNRDLNGNLLSFCYVLLLKDQKPIDIMSLPMIAQYHLKDGTWHEITSDATLGPPMTVPDPKVPICGHK